MNSRKKTFVTRENLNDDEKMFLQIFAESQGSGGDAGECVRGIFFELDRKLSNVKKNRRFKSFPYEKKFCRSVSWLAARVTVTRELDELTQKSASIRYKSLLNLKQFQQTQQTFPSIFLDSIYRRAFSLLLL